MRHIIGGLVLLILATCGVVYGQSRDTVIVRKFTQKDGLSSYNIRKIIQDRWGFMWIATQEGISRFDGKSFSNYSRNGPPGRRLCGSDIKEIIEDTARNQIWVSASQTGINSISTVSGAVEKTIYLPDLGPEGYNLSMLKCGDELWIGTSTGLRIFNCVKNKFETPPPVPQKQTHGTEYAARSLQQDEYGNVWVCYGGYGIVIYQPSSGSILKTIQLAELNDRKGMNEIRIPKFVSLKKGELLFATSQGLRKISYTNDYRAIVDDSPCNSLPVLNYENIDCITQETRNSLLVSGYNNLYRFDYSLNKHQTMEEATRPYETGWLSSVLCIFKDRDGNIWLGCQEGLGYINRAKTPFKPYNYNPVSAVKLDHVFAVSPVGETFLAGLRKGLAVISQLNNQYIRYDTGHLYQHVFTDQAGLTHLSRPDGLFIFKNHSIFSIDKHYPEFLSYATYSINSHIFVNDSLTILGTENNKGILLWNPIKHWVKSINAESSPPRLASSIVNNIFRDRQGRLWVLSDNVITILSADLRTAKKLELHETATGLFYKLFFDMCEAAGSYWIASYGSGILQVDTNYQVKKVFNTENGLSNDGVYQVYSSPDNHLLVTSNNGLSRIDLATGKISRYYVSDGLHSNAFEEVSGTMKDGKIYAGGVNGFTVIDPANFSLNPTPPRLYFTGIEMKTANGKIYDTTNLLMRFNAVPNNIFQTTIHFAGLNYSNPERTEYAYRILEQGGDWIRLGTQNFLQPIGLGPGTYTLQVKAANEDGVESPPIQLQLYFQPKWFQTWWFRSLVLAALTAFVYGLYRFRVNQIKREERLRRRLASDLHDDLGSTMNSVKIYTSLAIMEDGHSKYLQKIKDGTQDVIAGIRDVVWILDDKRDTVEQLVERINQFAYPLCEAAQIAFVKKVDLDKHNTVLEKEEKRNLYMILKEAINNSIKYAGCKTITLTVATRKTKMFLRIADDGRGFELEKLNRGNGLNNIERRSQEIGYEVSIKSSPSAGTAISLSNFAGGAMPTNRL